MAYKMDQLSTLSAEHLDRYYRIITESIGIRRHNELLAWLQGELQHYLPHEILIAAWGDFTATLICYDIVSAGQSIAGHAFHTDTWPDRRTVKPGLPLCDLQHRKEAPRVA